MIDTWEESHMKFWEDAVKGSSALQAALLRRLGEECAVALGYTTSGTFWDLAKFYDNIEWCKALEWACELHFPARLLRIVFSLHTAPRIVRVGKICSELICPFNSVIAGCSSAICLSRVMVCSILAETHQTGVIRSRNFFDDIVSAHFHQEPEDVVDTVVEHCGRLGQNIAKARLSHNQTKTVNVSSKIRVAKKIVKQLREKFGVEIKAACRTRDLGVDAAGGGRRSTMVFKQRVRKAILRLKRTRFLVRSHVGAARIIRTGAEASWRYGVEAFGATSATLDALRSATAEAAGTSGYQSCPVTGLRATLGLRADPLVVVTFLSVKWWIT